MRVIALQIRKRESYEDKAGQLVGSVTLEGITGKQEVNLSSLALSKIFNVISEEVIDTTKTNAMLTKAAMEEAIHGPLIEEKANLKVDLEF